MTTRTISLEALRERVDRLEEMPSIPAILLPLVRTLESPAESIDVQRVVDLIAHDKSLAAQTLHMANSPLFGRMQDVKTIRGAVVALGIARVRDIATTCCMLNLAPDRDTLFDIRHLWEHSLGVALVSRRLARKVGYAAPEHAYLAGLLHDIGLIVNLILFTEKFREVAELAQKEHVAMGEAEQKVFGFDHAISGSFLAEKWGLSDQLKETIRRHHQCERAQGHQNLVALVNVSDLVCRIRGLGYGYNEQIDASFTSGAGWQQLSGNCPALMRSDLEQLTFEIDSYLGEVRSLVSVIFRMQ